MNVIERFRKYRKGGYIGKFQPGGKAIGDFYTDEKGIVRRHNSDNTDTQVSVNQNGNYQWIQPDGQRVRSSNIYSLDGNTYFNIPDTGLQLTIDSEGMGPSGYEGYWYKRQKAGKGESSGWDGWFIGNGLSKRSYSNLIQEFGDPDSSDFEIKNVTIGGTNYQIAIPKQSRYQPLTVQRLSGIMRSNSNTDMTNLKISNPELFRLLQYSPSYVQDALYSLYHQYGSYVTDPNSQKYHKNDTPRIIQALRSKDYQKLSEIIRGYDTTYKTRRGREADYILNNL